MLIKNGLLYSSSVLDNPVAKNNRNSIMRFKGKHHNLDNGFSLTPEQLSSHIALIGSTNSGKTNTFKTMIPQLKSSLGPDDCMLIFDPKYDFREFHAFNDYVISNCKSSKANNVNWNIFGDVTADGWDFENIHTNSIELASVAFEDRIKKSSNPFFPQAASEIFAAVITAMALTGSNDKGFRVKYLNNFELRKYLRNLNAKRLADFLGKYPELTGVLKYVGNGRSDQSLGVFAELEQGVNFLTSIFAKKGSFSIRRTVRNRGGCVVFLEYDPSQGALGIPLRMIVDLFLKEVLSPNHKKGKVYAIIDELKMLSPLNYIEDALNFGRSLGVSVVSGLQSIEQLYETYGEYRGKNILSGFQSSFVFRTNNEATREYIKGIHGKNVSCIQYLDFSQKPKDTIREGNVIEDWNISSLNQGEAIVSLPSEKPFVFQFSKYR